MEDDCDVSEEEDGSEEEEDGKSDKSSVNTPDQTSLTSSLTCSTTTTTEAVPDPSASRPFVTTHVSLEASTDSALEHGLVDEEQNREEAEVTIPLTVPSKTEKEEDALPLIAPSENKDAIPLIVPAYIPSSSTLLCMEDEDEDVEVQKEALLAPSSSAPIHVDGISSSNSSNHTDKFSFKPLIEVMRSTGTEEEEEEEGRRGSEARVSISSLHTQTSRNGGVVSSNLSDPVHLVQDEKEEEGGWVRKEAVASERDNQQKWATFVTPPELQASTIESNNAVDGRLVVKDLQPDVLTPSPPVPPAHEELQQDYKLPVPPAHEDYKLCDVPIVSKATVEHVDTVLRGLEGKVEGEMSREDKVWKLAASGGSTLQDEAVTLDLQTRSRVKQGLQEAGLLDQVSLKF